MDPLAEAIYESLRDQPLHASSPTDEELAARLGLSLPDVRAGLETLADAELVDCVARGKVERWFLKGHR